MVSGLMLGAIRLYQRHISGLLPASCRYHPSCSEYTRLAVEAHGPARGVWLGARRLARCQPWGGYGIDLVPGTAVDRDARGDLSHGTPRPGPGVGNEA